MTESIFPSRWPAQHPDRIQLYSLATPNGQKLGVALEELGLPYEAHLINIMEGDQFDEGFVRINPNSKIPAIIDPDGPDGKPIAMMESGAILLYLAEKTGKLMPTAPKWVNNGLQPTKLAWLLKASWLPPIYFELMLKGHEWFAGPETIDLAAADATA